MSETQNIEYKSLWHDEYLKWICGFANAQGGKLYIGKDDNGKVAGVKNFKKLMEDLPFGKDIYNREELSNRGLSERQIDALLFFKVKGEMTTSEYAERYKVTDRTARNDLNELAENKILTKKGETNLAKYVYI